MGKKQEKFFTVLNHIVILASVVTGFVSTIAFASFVDITVGITSSALGL